ELVRVAQRRVEEPVGCEHAIYQAELGRSFGEQDASRQEQVQRPGGPYEPREDPGDAVLGDQAATGEGGGDLRALGGEPDVAHERLDQADAGDRAVDRRDDRLRNRQWERLRAPVTTACGGLQAVLADRAQLIHVGAGAEAAPGAR